MARKRSGLNTPKKESPSESIISPSELAELEASRKAFAEWWNKFERMSGGDPHFQVWLRRLWK
jgi:hypothetical protein